MTELAQAPTIDLFGLLSSIGMTRQTESALVNQMATAAWSSLLTAKVLPFIGHVLTAYVLMPILSIVKSLARALIFTGIFLWLLASATPIFLSAIGITGAGSFVGRALDSSSFPYRDMDISGTFRNLSTKGFEYLELESPECRQLVACSAGEFVLEHYPNVAAVLRNSGVGEMISAYSKKSRDVLAEEAWSVLLGHKNGTCSDDASVCPSFSRFNETIALL